MKTFEHTKVQGILSQVNDFNLRVLKTYRLVLLLSAILIPMIALIFHIEGIEDYPYYQNAFISILALFLFGITFWIPYFKKHVYFVSVAFMYVVILWAVFLLNHSNFSNAYILLSLTGIFVYSLVLKTISHVIWYCGVFLVSVIISLLIVDSKAIDSLLLLFCLIAFITASLLSAYFKDMVKEKLAQNELILRQIINQVSDALFILDKSTLKIIDFNSKAVELFPELLNINSDNLRLSHFIQDFTDITDADLRNVISSNGEWQMEISFTNSSNQQYWLLFKFSEALLGSKSYFITSASNITELKNYSLLIEQSKAELELVNKDLEQFVFVASHDLLEPLRTITQFIKLLLEKNQEHYDEKSKSFSSLITNATKRMDLLIRGLLKYAKIGNKNVEFKKQNLNSILDDVKESLDKKITDSGAQFAIEPLPKIMGNKILLNQLFQNLISNAIKFQKENTPPFIKIYSLETKRLIKIMFEDNGIGIPKSQHEHVFKMFQRLHAQTDYEGTGIGLASSLKIMEIHSGKINLTSEEGSGTTFILTFPKNP